MKKLIGIIAVLTALLLMGGCDPGAEPSIEELIELTESVDLENGISTSLIDAKLEHAKRFLDSANAGQKRAAVNKLNAYINQLEALSGKKISEEHANVLIAYAQELINHLEG